MKKPFAVGVGLLIAVMGVIWTLQGLGYVGGSVMSGVTFWAVVGPVVEPMRAPVRQPLWSRLSTI